MVSTKEIFSSLDMWKFPPKVVGDEYHIDSLGKGRIDLDHGKFNNVLYVLGLASNLLSVYQMNQTGYPKKVIFSPYYFEIIEILNGNS